MKSLIVGQSGGPTSVINASLAGVYYGAKKKGFDTNDGIHYSLSTYKKLYDYTVIKTG